MILCINLNNPYIMVFTVYFNMFQCIAFIVVGGWFNTEYPYDSVRFKDVGSSSGMCYH